MGIRFLDMGYVVAIAFIFLKKEYLTLSEIGDVSRRICSVCEDISPLVSNVYARELDTRHFQVSDQGILKLVSDDELISRYISHLDTKMLIDITKEFPLG